MAFRRLPPCTLLAGALLLSVLAVGSLAATGPGDIAVLWGRNKDEGTLREACDTGTYNTVILSFLTAFGHGTYTLDLSGHPLAGIGDDIKHCQSKGILVLLSIGGPSASAAANYSLPSPQSAADLADYLWHAFSPAATPAYPAPSATRRGVTLTATVRCAFPDPDLAAALATGLFSRIHVRLYGDLKCEWGQFDSWNKWAAAFPASRVFVGVVAAPEADQDAYLFQKDLYYGILQFAEEVPNYGGLMIWDRYYDKMNHYISSS
ncbi:unnamed protein product [Urochloa decumbens]|uniref:GH18 domain-containing protein n=1 Tax=Urochloa decumbens TaxID=240449 RepID=A0ABC9AMG3_9POAL